MHPEGVPLVQGPEEAGGAGQGAHGRDHDPELLSPVQAVHLLQTDDPCGSGHPERVPELLREQAVQEGTDQQPEPDGTADQLGLSAELSSHLPAREFPVAEQFVNAKGVESFRAIEVS